VSVEFSSNDAEKALKQLQKYADRWPKTVRSANFDVGNMWVRRAKEFAPISPKKEQISASLKRTSRTRIQTNRRGGVSIIGGGSDKPTKRQARPGGLQRSVKLIKYGVDEVAVGLPANSESRLYQDYIHNKRYKPDGWENLGIGSKRKVPIAREKFVPKAFDDIEPKILKTYRAVLKRLKERLER